MSGRIENKTEKGYSFHEDGQWYLVRCHECGRENYMIAVATGQCAWCGWKQKEKHG